MLSLSAIGLFSSALALFAFGSVAPFEAAESGGLGVILGAMGAPIANVLKRRRGRPRKFDAPSRAITLTLPESVLASLGEIDPDVSRAIVQLAKRRNGAATNGRLAAELAVFGKRAVISVRPTPSLENHAGIDLVPLPDGRALISFDQPQTVADLELTIFDALEHKDLSAEDRTVFEAIGSILREARRSEDVELLRRNIIVLESSNGSAPRKAVKSRSKS